jgi:phosphohistidine phosphatase
VKLLIMRHGEAQSFAVSDAARELTDDGRRQAELAGQSLRQHLLAPQRIYCSPYRRTQQTAAITLAAAGFDEAVMQTCELVTPDNAPAQVAQFLGEQSVDTLMMISHQPLVSALIGLLVAGQAFAGPPMAPASIALLEADVLLPGCCTLSWLRHAPQYTRSE